MENYSAWISFFFAHYESLSRGGGTVSLRLSRLKAKTQQALSGAAERFTSESLNRDRALLTPSACTVYSSSAGKHQHHQAVQAERQTESHVFVCVERLFFLLLAHSVRICLQKMVHFTWDNQSFWNDKQSRVPIQYWIIYRSLHTKLVCLSEHLSIYFVPLLNFELDFSQLLVTSQLCLKSWSLMLFHSWNTACRLSWHWWNTEWEGH